VGTKSASQLTTTTKAPVTTTNTATIDVDQMRDVDNTNAAITMATKRTSSGKKKPSESAAATPRAKKSIKKASMADDDSAGRDHEFEPTQRAGGKAGVSKKNKKNDGRDKNEDDDDDDDDNNNNLLLTHLPSSNPSSPVSAFFKQALVRFHHKALKLADANGAPTPNTNNNNANLLPHIVAQHQLPFPIPNNQAERQFLRNYKTKYGFALPTPQLGHAGQNRVKNIVPRLRLLVPKSQALINTTRAATTATTTNPKKPNKSTVNNKNQFPDPESTIPLPKLYIKMKDGQPVIETGQKVVVTMATGKEERVLINPTTGSPVLINGRCVLLTKPPARQRSLFSVARHTMSRLQTHLRKSIRIEASSSALLGKKNLLKNAAPTPGTTLNWKNSGFPHGSKPYCYLAKHSNQNKVAYKLSSSPLPHSSPLYLTHLKSNPQQPIFIKVDNGKVEYLRPFRYLVGMSTSASTTHHCLIQVDQYGEPTALVTHEMPTPGKPNNPKQKCGQEFHWTTITPTPLMRRPTPPTATTRPSNPNSSNNNNNNNSPVSTTTTTTTTNPNNQNSFTSNINFGALIEADNQLLSQSEQRNLLVAYSTDLGYGGDEFASLGSGNAAGASSTSMVTTSLVVSDFSELQIDPTTTLHDNSQSKCLVQIQNMVGVVFLGCPVDLKEIAMSVKNAEYNPRRFMSVVIRLRDPRTTALLFRSGKLLITGARTEHQTRLAARQCARLVQKLGHPNVTFNDFTISNMVGAADVRFPVNLPLLANAHAAYCDFESEIFPAVIYRMQHPNVVALIFVNGKVVLTAGKRREDLYTAFEHIYQLLLEFRKGGPADLAATKTSANHNNNNQGTATTITTTTSRSATNTSTGAFSPNASHLGRYPQNTTVLGERSRGGDESIGGGAAGGGGAHDDD
jgi:transcription initiation factor TFIID TATA-box-binding protein